MVNLLVQNIFLPFFPFYLLVFDNKHHHQNNNNTYQFNSRFNKWATNAKQQHTTSHTGAFRWDLYLYVQFLYYIYYTFYLKNCILYLFSFSLTSCFEILKISLNIVLKEGWNHDWLLFYKLNHVSRLNFKYFLSPHFFCAYIY